MGHKQRESYDEDAGTYRISRAPTAWLGLASLLPAGRLYAVLALILWLGMLSGHRNLLTAFDPVAWHAHEMLFGFALAAIAGFVLTAVPHWTGHPVLSAAPLAVLVLLWLVGRVAVAFFAVLGPMVAAAVYLLFPAVLVGIAGNDILRARCWRGLLLVAMLSAILFASLFMHLATVIEWWHLGEIGRRFGLGVIVVLISLIGGRVIPNFTGNWLQARGEPRPPLFGVVDTIALIATLASLLLWSVWPQENFSAVLLGIAGTLQASRLARPPHTG